MMRFGRIETKKSKHMYKNVPNDCGDTLERERKRERARKIEGEEERDCVCVCVRHTCAFCADKIRTRKALQLTA